ncbi:outer membrane beta-barrel protein [Mucilaginibacter pallidiroseus]|uniref:Outer membrane beta-barrel protein n=1 Tax=Mucilaginibacter pallidiroseus TaxID=2599295 RepID=A0A563UEJ1_9SPHI|nr:outer membrane beta-barrel protein [Mucilaginibacter pallidiroseus]TWR29679.1 outer membrane beta-barrel protein [Mucilaginibacter pallidiroseus]
MKTLKIAALVLAFAGLSVAAKAQSTSSTSTTTNGGIRYSIGVEAGVPTGNFNNAYKWNLGGSLQADIPVANQLFVTVNAGYNNVFGETLNVAGGKVEVPNVQLIPVKAGLKFFPVSNFYVQGEAGAAFLLNKSDFFNDKSVAFVYAPQIGVQFPVSASGNFIDAGVRYEGTTKYSSAFNASKVNFVGVRVAYGF